MHNKMKIWSAVSLLSLLLFASGPVVFAGGSEGPKSSGLPAGDTKASASQKQNIDEYVALLRENVRQQSAQITGAMMQLTPEESKKFWPIYDEYQKALITLNNSRVQNLTTGGDFAQMTDEKADQMIKEDINLRKQRDELLARSYERVKQSLGALPAARFLLVESQLQSIIDLQLDSHLPIGG
jgi:Spy/CpxP family protein refolding chaperone